MSRLKNVVKICIFGVVTFHDVFGSFLSSRNFGVDFLSGFGRPSKTLKKQMKINNFWLDCVLPSRFFMIAASSSCRFRIGLKKAKKSGPEMAALKNTGKLDILILAGHRDCHFWRKTGFKGAPRRP